MAGYDKGLVRLGEGAYAYLQPDGGWGFSNAGLVVSGSEGMVIDTLMDLPSAERMLAEMRAEIAGLEIVSCVNTHAHPDHTGGNAALTRAEIVSSTSTRDEMARMLAGADPIGHLMRNWTEFGEAGAYLHEVMGSRFEYDPARQTLPTRTFDGDLTVSLGGREVQLIEIGPAHTAGDVVVYLPDQRILFAGDVLFHQVHPLLGMVPPDKLRAACQRLLRLEVDIVVPGHGPITDLTGVRAQLDYLDFVEAEVRRRFDAGMDYRQAALDIPVRSYDGWPDPERIVITTANFYRGLGAEPAPLAEVMTVAAGYRRSRGGPTG